MPATLEPDRPAATAPSGSSDEAPTGLGWPETWSEAMSEASTRLADVSRETSDATGLGWPA